jgi:hypothetical protein
MVEFKPRKAPWGFKVRVDGANLFHVSGLIQMATGPNPGDLLVVELMTEGYNKWATVILYVHDADLASSLRQLME